MPYTLADYTTPYIPTWCPGCGDFGIWAALKKAYIEMQLPPHKVLHVYDIGCSGNGSNWFRSYAFHSLHGRSLPAAVGAKLANHELTVLAFAGDGGAYGEGGNHFIHTCRTNIDLVYVIHDNQLYSLTTGQASPTSDEGMKTKSTPEGDVQQSLRPLQLAISCGATFVARGYSDDMAGLSKIFIEAIKHRGFAVVDVLQPCVTFNLINTREWYVKHTKKLDDTGWDPSNKDKAFLEAGNWNDKIPIGVLYKEEKLTFEDHQNALKQGALITQVKKYDVSELVEEFR